jgi:5'-deoxynucleotidase YfbR-like HD superfamily hydrolase
MLPTLRVEQKEELVVLEAPEGKRMNKKYNESVRGRTQHVAFLDTKGLSEVDFPSLPSKEEMSKELQDFYEKKPYNSFPTPHYATVGEYKFNSEDAWIQTYSGRRFTPTNPNPDAIVIQDIAHALSNICRFTGHCSKFYSVAQHSVLVSYLCNQENALYGLLHDASEAYCQDIASPIKKCEEFAPYRKVELKIQNAVCKRFGLPEKEPPDVKKADLLLLATESRDLMGKLRSDWIQPCEPLPFKIVPLPPQEAKNLFMKRFFELTSSPTGYEHYLRYEEKEAI